MSKRIRPEEATALIFNGMELRIAHVCMDCEEENYHFILENGDRLNSWQIDLKKDLIGDKDVKA